MSDSEQINEEFNNFMHKVNEVSSIVKKLGSKDEEAQRIGTLEAQRYLNEDVTYENICEETVKLKFKYDRSVINKEALLRDETDQATMSQEAFMKQVSVDADKRYKDKMIRKERADTLKTQATKAFRRGEYEKALVLYGKAIEQIKDSCMLYTNRSLTQMYLERYDKAIEDAEKALYFNENSLKARLLLAKYHLLNGNKKEFNNAVQEAKTRNASKEKFIEEYVSDLRKSRN